MNTSPHGSPRRRVLSNTLFDELRSYIYERTGIYFRDNKRYLLESQVGRRVDALGMPDYESYLNALRNGIGSREFPHLVNAITINETFFFRHPDQYETLFEHLMQDLVDRARAAGRRTIRIWSAGCSSGDEAYTLALLIRERVQSRFPTTRFEIVGTDIDTDILAKARSGVYSQYAVRNIPDRMLKRYFTQRDRTFVLDPSIRSMVRFKQLNLRDRNAMRRLPSFDVALCANVLIYFDQTAKEQVVTGIHERLVRGGIFMIGVSETLFGLEHDFVAHRIDKTIAYEKSI